ncbi:TMEM175 family protein [Furfurilactobacillus entadae]|uniref:TMEM175 family protein n=1 Tax=Furfurilactobacillus entadae TaxID=2922307 RepID=UPI0035E6AEC0
MAKSQTEIEQLHQQIATLRKDDGQKLREHTEVFNDAVIAIIITIMVLEIPLPTEGNYLMFLKSIGIFIISFFMVGGFWYQLHNAYAIVKAFNKTDLTINFLYLVSLSLLPVMTKWVINDTSRVAVLNLGVVYLITSLFQLVITRQSHRKLWDKQTTGTYYSDRKVLTLVAITLAINIALIGLAWWLPGLAMGLYLALPLINFFVN